MKFKDKLQMFWRSFLLQAGWNYLRYQSIGFTFVMLPFLKKLYKRRELKAVLSRYMENFNTHPVMASYAYGALAKMEEEEVSKSSFKRTEWVMTKSFLMTSLASIGDRFFWDTLRPFAFVFSLLLAVLLHLDVFRFEERAAFSNYEAAFAAVVFLLIYNIPALLVRWKGFDLGYKSNADKCFGLLAFDWNKAIRVLKHAGFVCTALIVCFAVAGQFLYLELGVEFFLLAAILLFFIVFSSVADKFNVPVVYVYLITTAIFSMVMVII